jgi:predicted DCC family thiol-disulfide oxidoreductase YuxK
MNFVSEDSVARAIDINDTEGLDPQSLDRPILVWDGNCGFCKRCVLHLVAQLGERVRYLTYQSANEYFAGLRRDEYAQSVHFIEPDGSVYRGAAAIYRAYSWRPQGSYLMGIYRRSPVFAALSEWGYDRVARNRKLAGRIARLIPGW